MNTNFKTALFGGFDREDVVSYIQQTSRENQQRVSALEEENHGLQERNRAMEAELNTLRRAVLENSAAADTCLQLQTQLRELQEQAQKLQKETEYLRAQAAEYQSLKDHIADIEISAHRRTEEFRAKAIEQLRQLTRQQETWCAQSRAKYAELNRQFCQKLALAQQTLAEPDLSGFQEMEAGLRQLAAAILIFSGSIAFFDTKFFPRRFFRPGLAAALLLLVQSAYLIARPIRLWALCVFCMGLTAAVTDLLLAAGLCLSAGAFRIVGISVGMCLTCAFLMRSVRQMEPARGAAWGAAMGLCLGLLGDEPDLAPMAVLGLSCAALSRVRSAPAPVCIGTFWAIGGGCTLLFGTEEPLYRMIELFSGGILSLLPLPRLSLPPEKKRAQPEKPPRPDRLAKPAAALRDLYDSFFRGTAPEKPENPSVVFDRAAEQVCRRCILRDTCWRQNYSATYNAFNDACPRLLQQGEAQAGDFPLYFTSRCVHLSDFVGAVNVELRSYLLRQQYHRRLSEVRDQAREQYAQLGDMLASAGPAVPAGAQAMGYGVASSLRPRQGQSVCGDQLDSFEVGDTVYLLLSDGMGSGEAAHREAAMTVRLLRQFLEAGIEPGPALKTLNTALSLRGESGGGFTTIDLLALQRASGQAALYKYGAAPSYLKRSGSVSRYTGQSLPAGLQAVREAPECTRLQLTAGSFFVMVSDGIADAGNDEWLQNLLAGWSGRDANALVSLILAESRGRKGLEDDCAVLVLHLSSGEKKPV